MNRGRVATITLTMKTSFTVFLLSMLALFQAGAAEVNYYRDVVPVLHQHCNVCHREGDIAPFALDTYERASRKAHLKRLTAGDTNSFASSDIHLETAYSLKELNSWIVTVAHPILHREGQLLDSRLAPGSEPEGG